jgi:hypothetical protein
MLMTLHSIDRHGLPPLPLDELASIVIFEQKLDVDGSVSTTVGDTGLDDS